MKKKIINTILAAAISAIAITGCAFPGLGSTQDEEETEESRDRDDEDEDDEEDEEEPEEDSIDEEEQEKEDEAKEESEKDATDSEDTTAIPGTGAMASTLPDVGTEITFRGWNYLDFGTEPSDFFRVDDIDYNLDYYGLITVEYEDGQKDFVRDHLVDELEITFIYSEDLYGQQINRITPTSIKLAPEDKNAGNYYDPETDPLRGLVADDILSKFRATNAVKEPDSIYGEGDRLGHWVQQTIGLDGFSDELREMGSHIGNANEYFFGTDVANNFNNNIPSMYGAYFTLKDYYTSDGERSADFFESVMEDCEYLGSGDPDQIKEMYDDLQEFITACNNIIREK